MINIILAYDKNYAIGKDNDLIYHFSEDLKRFKELTKGKTIVMGRKTWESLPNKLPNRKHIVLTRDTNYKIVDDSVTIMNDINDIELLSQLEDIWVIGGSSIYKELRKIADRIEVTYIHNNDREYDQDVSFMNDINLTHKITKKDSLFSEDKIRKEFLKIDFITLEKI